MASVWAQSIPQSGVTPPQTGATPSPSFVPEYAPKGLPLGAFRLYPALELAFDSDDNVFRVNNGMKGDTFFEITPRLALQSQWARHYLTLRGGATDYIYSQFSSESRVDWDVDAEGRVDVSQGIGIYGGGSYRHTFEPRSSPDQLKIAREPTPFNVAHGDVRVQAMPNRFGIIAGANYDHYQYDPTECCLGLPPSGESSNKDRDYTQWDLYTRLLYEFSPGYSAFAHVAYNVRDFDLQFDRNGDDRDSHGYRANVGVQMELTRLLLGELYAGYLEQTYNHEGVAAKAPLGRDSGFNYGAELTWLPSPELTVRLSASHQMNETIITNATDSNEQRFAFGVDWSIRRNIILHGDVAYLHDNFTGSGREDDLALASIGATYLMNNYVSWNFRYTYQNRDSNVPLEDFEDSIFRIGLVLQL